MSDFRHSFESAFESASNSARESMDTVRSWTNQYKASAERALHNDRTRQFVERVSAASRRIIMAASGRTHHRMTNDPREFGYL